MLADYSHLIAPSPCPHHMLQDELRELIAAGRLPTGRAVPLRLHLASSDARNVTVQVDVTGGWCCWCLQLLLRRRQRRRRRRPAGAIGACWRSSAGHCTDSGLLAQLRQVAAHCCSNSDPCSADCPGPVLQQLRSLFC
jgi:hypothetical protein